MTSGIYHLNFSETANYIGKSIDIERRWKEHTNKFLKGTAAVAMQDAYARYGMPRFNILLECHPDHIDLLESIFISGNSNLGLLNAAAAISVPVEDHDVLLSLKADLQKSTADHLRELRSWKEKYNSLLDSDITVKNLMEELDDAENYIGVLKEESAASSKYYREEIRKLRSKTLWDYIFS